MTTILVGLLNLIRRNFCIPTREDPEIQPPPPPSQRPTQDDFPPLVSQQQPQHHPHPQQQHPHPHPHPHPQSHSHSPRPHRPMDDPEPLHESSPPPGLNHNNNTTKINHHRINENLENQHNPHYLSLRSKAREEGAEMARCFDAAHDGYESNDGRGAHELSEEGHRHQREMERLDGEAAEWIFKANNTDSGPNEVDLHGLFVKEAIYYTDISIQEAQQRGDTEIHLIVGKGLHSTHHVAKLKPAIEELMQKHGLTAHLDPHNSGVLIVRLAGGAGEDGMSSDEVIGRLEKDDEDCVVM